ncbi:MAG: hypothetical protein IKF80_05775 [Erysipelotrichaceae bacterium]|nr:hypothetical protein [Erysipelotrichaceae bacterium]
MWYKRSFDIDSAYNNIVEMDSALKHIDDALKNYNRYDGPENMSYDDLDNIIYRAEKIALTCRFAIENKEKTSEYFERKEEKNYMKNLPVSVNFTDGILKIQTPFTFKRMYREGSAKENYVLMNYVRAALSEWKDEQGNDLFQIIKPPFDVYIIRRKKKWNSIQICDHDNLENGRIINEIFMALGYSDNAGNVDLHCQFRLVDKDEDEGMLFVVKSRNEAAAN